MIFKLPAADLLFRGLSLAGLCALGSAVAATGAPTAGARPATAKPAAARKAPAKAVDVAPSEATAEQVAAAEQVYYGVYDCEFNQTVHIEKDGKHASYVDVKHGKWMWVMKPVLSSTGAIRLEDIKGETLMVQISSKSMLLNVKTAHRIVDDCVSPKQRELIEAAKTAKAADVARAADAAKAAADPAATVATSASLPAVAPAPAATASISPAAAATDAASAAK